MGAVVPVTNRFDIKVSSGRVTSCPPVAVGPSVVWLKCVFSVHLLLGEVRLGCRSLRALVVAMVAGAAKCAARGWSQIIALNWSG